MAGKGTIRVEGGRRLRSTLKAAGDDFAELKAAHLAASALVAAVARARAPARTGRLAASVRPAGTKTQAIIRAGYAAVPYAGAVHWGTGPRLGQTGPHNIPSNPFISEAAQATEPTWTRAYFTEAERILATVKGA